MGPLKRGLCCFTFVEELSRVGALTFKFFFVYGFWGCIGLTVQGFNGSMGFLLKGLGA